MARSMAQRERATITRVVAGEPQLAGDASPSACQRAEHDLARAAVEPTARSSAVRLSATRKRPPRT